MAPCKATADCKPTSSRRLQCAAASCAPPAPPNAHRQQSARFVIRVVTPDGRDAAARERFASSCSAGFIGCDGDLVHRWHKSQRHTEEKLAHTVFSRGGEPLVGPPQQRRARSESRAHGG